MSRPFRRPLPEFCKLLAPAGNLECLSAALRAGADGVYFGGRVLNARQKAENFDREQLKEAAALCREYGAESFITLNTLLKESEFADAFDLLCSAAEAGITGVIVQDMALPEKIKKFFPTLELHASTQMAVTSLAGAKYLEALGFDQVVLARECSKKEVENICRNTNLKVEVFCHGALCMALSGQCYLSALIGNRSGNRGLCAQPCRLDFSIPGFENCLSLKDLCLVDELEQIRQIGVQTLKIEGRLKRPEYVMAAVSAYRAALDGRQPDLRALQGVFSRTGFTKGFFGGPLTTAFFGVRRKEDVCAAEKSLLGEIRHKNEKEAVAIPLKGIFRLEEEAVELWASDGVHEARIRQRLLQTPPGAEEEEKQTVLRLLNQTGGTPYAFETLCYEGRSGHLPEGILRGLRRDALAEISRQRRAYTPPELPGKADFLAAMQSKEIEEKPCRNQRVAVCLKKEQALALPSDFEVYLPKAEALEAKKEMESERIGVLLPPVFFEREEEAFLKQLAENGFRKVLADSPGAAFAAAKAGFSVFGGPRLNLRNRAAELAWRKLGVETTTRSFESGVRELDDCDAHSGVVVYGRLPLMNLRACPRKAQEGCASCKKHYEIKDRTGRVFPVFCGGEVAVLTNADRLWLGDKLSAFRNIGRHLFLFTDEDAKEVRRVCTAFDQGLSPAMPFTRGLYWRKEGESAEELRQNRLNSNRKPAERCRTKGRKQDERQNQTAPARRQNAEPGNRRKRRV